MVRKRFFKKNWDIISAYSVFILGVIITAFALSSCGGGWGCLGFVLIALAASGIFHILLIIALVRTIRNKKLSRKRWWWILTPWIIGIASTIVFMVGGNPGMVTTLILALLSPITIILYLINITFGANLSPFSVVGNEIVNSQTIQNFQETLKQFPYLETGIKQALKING